MAPGVPCAPCPSRAETHARRPGLGAEPANPRPDAAPSHTAVATANADTRHAPPPESVPPLRATVPPADVSVFSRTATGAPCSRVDMLPDTGTATHLRFGCTAPTRPFSRAEDTE